MIGFLEKHHRKIAWIYIVLTFIKFFTANIYLVREEDPTIYFKLVPTIQNTFYRGGDNSATHEYYKGVHSWYGNDQFWEIFHSPGGMQDIVEVCYNIVIGAWWVLSAALICFALYHLLKQKKSPQVIKFLNNKALWRGNIALLSFDNALPFIELCKIEKIKILGIDTFLVFENGIQPILEESSNYSTNKSEDTWAKAKEFILSKKNENYYYEFVLENKFQDVG